MHQEPTPLPPLCGFRNRALPALRCHGSQLAASRSQSAEFLRPLAFYFTNVPCVDSLADWPFHPKLCLLSWIHGSEPQLSYFLSVGSVDTRPICMLCDSSQVLWWPVMPLWAVLCLSLGAWVPEPPGEELLGLRGCVWVPVRSPTLPCHPHIRKSQRDARTQHITALRAETHPKGRLCVACEQEPR